MDPRNFLGNLILLIVGRGNGHHPQTPCRAASTRSAGIRSNTQAQERSGADRQLRAEVIRWQTPLAHMRRTALQDIEFRGKTTEKATRS